MADRILGGRYRLGEPLGRGGMSVVWRAHDESLGREVAVKAVDLTGPDRDAAAIRFEREARATARLNHPNIVTVYDYGVDGDTAYIAMELLDGPTLSDRVAAEGPLPVAEVRALGEAVCAALSAAHRSGVVHRDIKPNNIAFAADGTPKVLDFGINQALDDATPGLTKTNTIVGTAEYLSPEQTSGARVDERADVYALGCVLYAALTGRPPFEGPTPVSVLMKHVQEPAPDVRLLRAGIPDSLAAALSMMLAKDPAQRPQSAQEAADLLSGRMAADPTTVLSAPTTVLPTTRTHREVRGGPVAVPPPTPPPAERTTSWAWLGWLIALAALAFAGYLVWQELDGRAATDRTTPTSQASTSAPPSTVIQKETVTITTTPPPATTESSTPPPTVDPATAAADVRSALESVIDDEQVSEKAGEELTDQLDKVDEAIEKNGNQAQKAVGELASMLQTYADSGDLQEAAAAALGGPMDALVASVSG